MTGRAGEQAELREPAAGEGRDAGAGSSIRAAPHRRRHSPHLRLLRLSLPPRAPPRSPRSPPCALCLCSTLGSSLRRRVCSLTRAPKPNSQTEPAPREPYPKPQPTLMTTRSPHRPHALVLQLTQVTLTLSARAGAGVKPPGLPCAERHAPPALLHQPRPVARAPERPTHAPMCPECQAPMCPRGSAAPNTCWQA